MIRKFAAKRGQVIFQPGAECPGFLRLDEGCIRVSLTGVGGREVVLYRVRPGEVCLQTFSCLIEGHPYGAEGVAETDLSGELVPADRFRARLETDSAFRDEVLASVALRFAEYQELIEDVALTGFDARLAKVLLKLVDAQGFVDVTHAALARETASGRAYVTRRLAAFAGEGIVRQEEHGISVIDSAALWRIATQSR